jgi:hypothetical protein
MKITKRQLRKIIREALILEAETADTSDAEDAAQAFADKYGKMGHTSKDRTDGSLIIHVRERLIKQFGQEIAAAVKENGWTTQSVKDRGDIFVFTTKQEIKPPQKKSLIRRMLGI